MCRYISEAILSVWTQTLQVLELIVVDDGSNDDTAREAEATCKRLTKRNPSGQHPAVLVFSQQRRGTSSARNLGIRVTSEPWIAFLDADDVWSPQKIELQWSMISRYPMTGIVSCQYQTFKDGEQWQTSIPPGSDGRTCANPRELGRFLPRVGPGFFKSGFVPLPSTVIVRRDAIESAGGFDENMQAVEDYECIMRILAHFPLAIVERPLMGYRQHATNTHLNLPLMEKHLHRYCELVIANPHNYPPGAVEASLRGLNRVRSCYMLD
jgi:glycosyltransferase involved in cell wall biosynthesis